MTETKRQDWRESRKQGIYFNLDDRFKFNDWDSELGKRGWECQEVVSAEGCSKSFKTCGQILS